jgi:pyridoxal phosphate enzyme (YggS family)
MKLSIKPKPRAKTGSAFILKYPSISAFKLNKTYFKDHMLSKNIEAVLTKIEDTARQAGKNPAGIKVVFVTKYAEIEDVAEAVRLGYVDIGENRLQEIKRKKQLLKGLLSAEQLDKIRWHFIGHLQTNKAADVASFAYLIQSVDSLRLADKLNQAALKKNKTLDILVQINIGGEQAKSGIIFENLEDNFKNILEFPNLNIKGLMGIGPYYEDPEQSRPGFKKVKDCFDRLNEYLGQQDLPLMEILSMGMSHDYTVAIEEGANMVRIGSAIFGG